ncbi:MAG TPA: translation elongation factor Ts [Bacteroidaceae bacterium]|jgi:elongation factor Ts|nr:elongation factor Ts [Bacteroidaceae bacterium]NLA93786.1 elongation factor Ts [Bacteroidales bacterium]OPZ48840.1 MAG: Elongation factor Ts [Bacteroidetes bacterium ADurb.BinA104]MBP8602218.1 elongation factor Ts [Bacteroidaceae bacterium]HBA12744.1 elongation factor Ts [Bacteroidales bacterium]
MAVTLDDIKSLRAKTGAGMSDCKKALTEADGDFEKAIEIIRKKGLAVAAKRSDREASEGCVLVKVEKNFGAMIALRCETDFVAKNADFIALTESILDAAIAARCKSLDEVKALPFQGKTIADIVIERTGIIGEKLELDGYNYFEAPEIDSYNHQGKNFLCCLVAFNKEVDDKDYIHEIALQVAAQNPIAVRPEDVPADIVAREREIAADKARQEGKPEAMIERIVDGRMKKFFDESCLLNQKYLVDDKKTVAEYLKAYDKDLTVTGFHRFSLRAE